MEIQSSFGGLRGVNKRNYLDLNLLVKCHYDISRIVGGVDMEAFRNTVSNLKVLRHTADTLLFSQYSILVMICR